MSEIRDRHTCPCCDSQQTNTVAVEWSTDVVEETVLCTHCEVTYTIEYRDMVLVSMIDEYGQELLGEE